jgi:hypothetical protein
MHEICVKMDLVECVAWSGSRSVTQRLKALIGWLACPTSMDLVRGRLNVDGYDVGGGMTGRWNSSGTYCGSDSEIVGLRWSGSGLVVDFVMYTVVMNATVSKCTFYERLEGTGCACIHSVRR